ncbi:MAG: DUF503 domain-containing protein [Syntrophales bacterium]|nr:DUF503 domain-containing protein [Syntrophales bacterium]MDY0043332.1 DUF503 domain-containing protein [Syntrophales bacterium]
MVVGTGIVELFIPESRSLKEKRSVLKRVVGRTQQTFSLSIAEVGEQDNWKRSKIGFAVVGNDRGFIESKMAHIARFIEDLHLVDILDLKKEIINISNGMEGHLRCKGKFDDD